MSTAWLKALEVLSRPDKPDAGMSIDYPGKIHRCDEGVKIKQRNDVRIKCPNEDGVLKSTEVTETYGIYLSKTDQGEKYWSSFGMLNGKRVKLYSGYDHDAAYKARLRWVKKHPDPPQSALPKATKETYVKTGIDGIYKFGDYWIACYWAGKDRRILYRGFRFHDAKNSRLEWERKQVIHMPDMGGE